MTYNKKWHRDYYSKNREEKLKYQNERYHNTHDIKPRSFSEEIFQQRLKENYGGNLTTLTPYKNSKAKILVKCKVCGNEWLTKSNYLLRGRGCKKCVVLKQRKTKEFFKEEFTKKYENKYELLTDYINASTKVKIKCKLCNNIWLIKPSHLTYSKSNCPKCSIIESGLKRTKSHEQFIKDVEKIHDHKYDIIGIYTKAKTKIEIKCNECKTHWNITPNSLLRGVGCPVCKQSKGEFLIKEYLQENNIYFKNQFTFEDCKRKNILRFDFYLPSLNICVEYDGIQHFKSVEYFGGDDRFVYTKENDKIKNDFCKKNKIKLIRIPYKEFKNIKELLSKKIKQNF